MSVFVKRGRVYYNGREMSFFELIINHPLRDDVGKFQEIKNTLIGHKYVFTECDYGVFEINAHRPVIVYSITNQNKKVLFYDFYFEKFYWGDR